MLHNAKQIYIILCAIILALSPHRLIASNDGFTLIWEDDFNAPTLDTTCWNVDDNARGGGNAEMQYYTPRNVSIERHPVSGETCLVLNAKREDYRNRPATSGRVNTQDKVTVCYGKIEARIAFPYTGNGLWPAFWLLGNNLATNLGNDDSIDQKKKQLEAQGRVVWPKCGEIDIVEMGHKDGIEKGLSDRYFNGAAHWGESFNDGKYPNKAGVCAAPYPVQGDFHLFTVIWTEDSLAMYLDQDQYPEVAPYFALSLRDKSINKAGHYFNHPFYIVLNLAVGGFFPGLPMHEKYPEVYTSDHENFQKVTALPADGTPVKMYIDYIKIYQGPWLPVPGRL